MSAHSELPMDSNVARERIQLYLYGELSYPERLEIERACEEDADFRILFEDEKALLGCLSEAEPVETSEALLAECRHNLMRAVYLEEIGKEKAPLTAQLKAWKDEVVATFSLRKLAMQPAMAALLLVAGFGLGRWNWADTGFGGISATPSGATVSAGSPDATEVQSVQHDAEQGHVRIILQRRQVVSGTPADPRIRGLLLTSVKDSHSGARLASLEALRRHIADQEVRQAFLRSLTEDENPGVRVKALEAMRATAADHEVQQALIRSVLTDPNPGIRVQAVQLLTANPTREMVGALQRIVAQESNPYVQQQCEKVLRDLGASTQHH